MTGQSQDTSVVPGTVKGSLQQREKNIQLLTQFDEVDPRKMIQLGLNSDEYLSIDLDKQNKLLKSNTQNRMHTAQRLELGVDRAQKQTTFIEQQIAIQQKELDFAVSPENNKFRKSSVIKPSIEVQASGEKQEDKLQSREKSHSGDGGVINTSQKSSEEDSESDFTSDLSEDQDLVDEAVLSEIEREQKERLKQILGRLQASVEDTRDHRKVSAMVKDELESQEEDNEPNLREGFFLVPVQNLNDVVRCIKPQEQKILVYEQKSLFIFDHRTKFRQFMVRLIHHPIFENLVILAIAVNSLLLAIYDYKDRDNVTEYNKICEKLSSGFTIFFTCEFAIKILAMGFVVHKNSYLRDYWNWLDTLVVLVGFIELMPFMNVASLRSLRVLRVLRPLRSISAFPNLKRQINTLLNSVNALFSAVLFMFFIFFLFGILGVQQFEGTMYQRCRLTEFPTSNDTWPYDESIESLCRKPENGQTQCPEGTWCKNPIDGGLPLSIDNVIDMQQIDYGLTNFDHLGWAMLTIFQMMTVEGWTKIMYNLMDSNIQWMSVLFSISLVLITSFFALNILLAILAEQNTKQGQQLDSLELEEKAKQVKRLNKSIWRASKQNGIIDKDKKKNDQCQKTTLTRPLGVPFDNEEGFLEDAHDPKGLFCFRKRKLDQKAPSIEDSNQQLNESVMTERVQNLEGRSDAQEPGISVMDLDKSVGQSNQAPFADSTLVPEKSITIGHDIRTIDDRNQILRQELNSENSPQKSQEAEKAYKNLQKFQQNSQLAEAVEAAKQDKEIEEKTERENRKSHPPSELDEYTDKTPMEFGENLEVEQAEVGNSTMSIFKTDVLQRAQKNKVYMFFFKLCIHPVFTLFIILMIVWNTIVLASDSYPPDQQYEESSAILNTFFTYTFLAEMIIKLLGMGIREYAGDNFNLFDAAIVIVSLVEVAIERLGGSSGNQGAFSAFRSIRLLRTFKIVKSWKQFHQLLKKITSALANLRYFLVLLILNMLIFTLCGMQLFGYTVKTNSSNEVIKEPFDPLDTQEVFSPRPNFDGFFNGFISVFIIFIGEDWQQSMYEHYRGLGILAVVFFPIVYIALCQIMFNLFLAILIESFITSDNTKESNSDDTTLGKIKELYKQFTKWWKHQWKQRIKPSKGQSVEVESADTSRQGQSPIKPQDSNVSARIFDDSQSMNLIESPQRRQNIVVTPLASLQEIDESLSQLSEKQSERNTIQKLDRTGSTRRSHTLAVKMGTVISNLQEEQKMTRSYVKPEKKFSEPLKSSEEYSKNSQRMQMKKKFSTSEQKLREQERAMARNKSSKNIVMVGKSLGIFSPKNKVRQICYKIVSWHPSERINYDNAVLLLIAISTILLTLDNPLRDQSSTEAKTLKYIDYVMTVIFTLECVINIVLFGLLLNGEESYLKSSWNKMDAFIVVLAIVSVAMEGTGLSLNYLKVFRMLRVLRPLRVLKRNPGMKIQVLSLLNGASSYLNLMLITMLVIVLFGIQGITFFKGKFYFCSTENLPQEIVAGIHNMWDCYDVGGEWVRFNANFDNIGNAVITIFNLMTTEGWIDVMWKAVDTTEIYNVPIRNATPFNVVFFICFLLVGSMILLNAFVGVLIMNFTEQKLMIYKEDRLTSLQHAYCEISIKACQAQPKKEQKGSGSKIRDNCLKIAKSEGFKNFITLCIILNTVCLALSWLGQPEKWKFVLGIFNYIFTAIYTIEFLIKIIALKAAYFSKGWNVFDFSIVISAAVGIITDIIFKVDIGFATTIIRSFRIARILKIAKRLKKLQEIVNSFVIAIPELVNVGGLLILFIYLYSVLGVFLFSHVKYSDHLNEHANFRDFPTAALTLFRIVTGEGWHDIMFDCARQKSIFWSCTNDQTYDEQQRDGIQGCGDTFFSYLFFISYMLIVSFIFLNLFMAIILEGYSTAQRELELARFHKAIKLFQKKWRKYDKTATGFISINDLEKLIMDLMIEEFKELEKNKNNLKEDEDPVVFFGLHKERTANVYTMWKVIEKEIDLGNDQDNEIHKLSCFGKGQGQQNVESSTYKIIWQAAAETSPALLSNDFKYNANRQRYLTRHMRRFIGSLEIPTYSMVTHYNFYDTLDCLIKRMFQDQLKERFKKFEEKKQMEDLIVPGTIEFDQLPLTSKEQIQEEMTEDFNVVLERLEYKQEEKIQLLQRTSEIRSKVEANKRKIAEIDIFKNEQTNEQVVIDSSQVTGAQIIIKFILKKKEKRMELKRKITLARRKTLFTKRQSNQSNMTDLALAKKLTMKQKNWRRSENPIMPLPALKYNTYGPDEIGQEKKPEQPEILINEEAPPMPEKVKISPQKTVQIAEKFIKPEEIKVSETEDNNVKAEQPMQEEIKEIPKKSEAVQERKSILKNVINKDNEEAQKALRKSSQDENKDQKQEYQQSLPIRPVEQDIIIKVDDQQELNLPKIDQKNKVEEIHQIEITEPYDQESQETLTKPEIQVEVDQVEQNVEPGTPFAELSEGNQINECDEKQEVNAESLKEDLEVPQEHKQSLKESNSDSKNGRTSESHSRNTSSNEYLPKVEYPLTEKKQEQDSKDQKDEPSKSPKMVVERSQNRDNKSPPRKNNSEMFVEVRPIQKQITINAEYVDRLKRKVTVVASETSNNEQDDDAGGGVPARGVESGQFSMSSDKGMNMDDSTRKSVESPKQFLAVGLQVGPDNARLVNRGQSQPPSSPAKTSGQGLIAKSPKQYLEFRKNIRAQLVRGMTTSPNTRQDKKFVQNKLLTIKQSTKELISGSSPSIQAIMHHNMNRMASTQTVSGNKRVMLPSKLKLRKNEINHQKWNNNDNDGMGQKVNSATDDQPESGRRSKSTDPNSNQQQKIPYAKKQTSYNMVSRENSLSVKPISMQVITRAKAEKIEILKQLYDQK